MSQYNAGGDKGYVATAALGDGVIVKIASGEVVVAAAATDKFIGVTVGAVGAGETANVRLRSAEGTIKVKAGGTVAVGDYVTSNASGQAVTATAAAAGAVPTSEVLGVAVEAGVSGDLIEVMPAICRI